MAAVVSGVLAVGLAAVCYAVLWPGAPVAHSARPVAGTGPGGVAGHGSRLAVAVGSASPGALLGAPGSHRPTPATATTPTRQPGGSAPAYFPTLPPGASLPSSAQCARWVLARPVAENKGANRSFNRVTGQHLPASFFPAGDSPLAGQLLAPRVDGNFTGSTEEILRWAACKWGIDQDIVFAQAAVESWWNQTTLGDWGSDASSCPPGHGPGVDGKPGLCPQSWGVLQNRYPFEQASWPGIASSTAMNADTAYAIWRSCFDGYEVWLNNVDHGQPYHAGDEWGCVGRWFAGRWRTSAALGYIARVQQYLQEKIWLQPDFQQP